MPGVGTVVGGLVTQGYIVENMPLLLGPFEDGKFRDVFVSSIRRNKAACRSVFLDYFGVVGRKQIKLKLV